MHNAPAPMGPLSLSLLSPSSRQVGRALEGHRVGTGGALGGRQPGIPAAPPRALQRRSREVPSDLLDLLGLKHMQTCSLPRGGGGGIEGAGSLAKTSWELGCRLQAAVELRPWDFA